MWAGIDLIAANLLTSVDRLIVLLFMCAVVIFAARDFKIAALISMVGNGGLFLWFYNWHTKDPTILYSLPLIIFFMSIAVLALTIIPARQEAARGGFI